MEEYVEIKNNQFQLIRVGDYIRWHTETAISVGGTIAQVGKNTAGHNWRVKGHGNFEFTIYWNKYTSVFVRKDAMYDILEARINVLSSVVNFLIKELNLENEFGEVKKKIQHTAKVNESIKTNKAKTKRRTKSVPPLKK